MYIDVNAYIESKNTIVNWLAIREQKDLIINISMIAVITSCPCVVVAYYAGEAFGWSTEVVKYIARLIEFYGYDQIDNKPLGGP
jgi:hypothetical protein